MMVSTLDQATRMDLRAVAAARTAPTRLREAAAEIGEDDGSVRQMHVETRGFLTEGMLLDVDVAGHGLLSYRLDWEEIGVELPASQRPMADAHGLVPLRSTHTPSFRGQELCRWIDPELYQRGRPL